MSKPINLRVTENRRYLEYSDGTPFLYLGDTAWELFHRLNLDDSKRYLANRAAKGFTVVQAVVLAEQDGLNTPNANGHKPLDGNDPTKPNADYFAHVDAVVDHATGLGLFIGMLPTWGRYWSGAGAEGSGCIFTPQSARAYGAFLGGRYKEKRIVWILGGDRNATNDAERDVVAAMAAGLRDGDGGAHLITFHPMGPGRSAEVFGDAPWLDFNMSQSSHGGHDHDNGVFAEADYALTPPKPTVDGEPRYECLQVGFYFQGANRLDRFDDYDARQAAYWSLLAGACGHTYGNNNIWQMWEPKHKSVLAADIPWHEAIDHPGAYQMGHVRRLFESRPFQRLVPDQSMILSGATSGGAKIRAARDTEGQFAFIYTPRGEQFTLSRSVIGGDRIREAWYDPRYGCAHRIHAGCRGAMQTYTPPTSGRGCDWVLVIEDDAADFPPPGK
jgi:hypothetical protein